MNKKEILEDFTEWLKSQTINVDSTKSLILVLKDGVWRNAKDVYIESLFRK